MTNWASDIMMRLSTTSALVSVSINDFMVMQILAAFVSTATGACQAIVRMADQNGSTLCLCMKHVQVLLSLIIACVGGDELEREIAKGTEEGGKGRDI